jgi:hypothetical protein
LLGQRERVKPLEFQTETLPIGAEKGELERAEAIGGEERVRDDAYRDNNSGYRELDVLTM